jgi:hypothetical protein
MVHRAVGRYSPTCTYMFGRRENSGRGRPLQKSTNISLVIFIVGIMADELAVCGYADRVFEPQARTPSVASCYVHCYNGNNFEFAVSQRVGSGLRLCGVVG